MLIFILDLREALATSDLHSAFSPSFSAGEVSTDIFSSEKTTPESPKAELVDSAISRNSSIDYLMLIRLTIKKRSLYIASGIAAVLLVVIISFALFSKDPVEAQAQYYAKRLEKLQGDVKVIASLGDGESNKSSVADQVNNYREALIDILSACHQMDERYEKIKDDPKLKLLRERIDKVYELCTDLKKVADYARKHSEATQDFILFPSSSLANQSGVLQLQNVLDTTKATLENLKQDPLNDSAVPELFSLIEGLQLQAKNANDQNKLTALDKQVQIHQANFQNARTYFWNNTIGIGQLQQSIQKLQSQL